MPRLPDSPPGVHPDTSRAILKSQDTQNRVSSVKVDLLKGSEEGREIVPKTEAPSIRSRTGMPKEVLEVHQATGHLPD